MVMTEEEIARSYREAKDPRAQVKVLADLNVTTPKAIKEKLVELGVISEGEAKRRSKLYVPIDAEKAKRLWDEGKSDEEIAEAVGVGLTKFKEWRCSEGMTRHKSSKPKKVQDEKETRGVEDAAPYGERRAMWASPPTEDAGGAEPRPYGGTRRREGTPKKVQDAGGAEPRPYGETEQAQRVTVGYLRTLLHRAEETLTSDLVVTVQGKTFVEMHLEARKIITTDGQTVETVELCATPAE